MLRKDYLLQQIEMLSGLVTELLRRREAGDAQGAADQIDQSYHDLFGFDPHLISLLPSDFLFDKLRSGEYLDADKGITLAILLREDASNYLMQGNAVEHFQRLVRSLKVFLAIARENKLLPEQAALYDVGAALDQMDDYELPDDLKYDLFQYYEDIGNFAQAEDMLHELILSGESNESIRDSIVPEGISFYEWLLTLTDEELSAGNLPRAEVEEGLAHVKRLVA